jgi:hypothetical protein
MNEFLDNFFLVVWNLKWWIVAAILFLLAVAYFFSPAETVLDKHQISWWNDPDHDGPSSEGWRCSCKKWGYDILGAQAHLKNEILEAYGKGEIQ